MNILYKHISSVPEVSSHTRLQRIQDRQALIKSINSLKEVRNELIMIAVFGGMLLILCISMANTILQTKGI